MDQRNLLSPFETPSSSAGESREVSTSRKTSAEGEDAHDTYADWTPDERPLWRLLHDDRLAEFASRVATLERDTPTWKPSAPLAAEAARLRQEQDIAVALKAGSAGKLLLLIAHAPDAFNCAHLDRVWKTADVFTKTGHVDEVNSLYRTVIAECKSDSNRIVTLYRAERDLPSAQADALIELEAANGKRDSQGEAAFHRLRYERAVAALGKEPPGSEDAVRQLSALAPSILAYRDGPVATLAGWIALAHHDVHKAVDWFESAQTFTPDSIDATLGLAQARIEMQAYDIAQALLDQPWLHDDPRARKARAQIAFARADATYKQHRYRESLQWLEVATIEGLPPTESALLRGWNLYSIGAYAQAVDAFRISYEKRLDDNSAEGLAQAMHAINPDARSDRTVGEPGEDSVDAYLDALDAQQQYYRKQFVQSQATLRNALSGPADPQQIGRYVPSVLTGIDAPSVAGGLTWADHIGASGQGRLNAIAPELRGEWIHNTTLFELRYRQLFLNTGTTSLDQTVPESLPAFDAAVADPKDNKAKLNDEVRRWTMSGSARAEELQVMVADTLRTGTLRKFDWTVSLGATQGAPSGFQPNVFGTIGQQMVWGAWSVYAGMTPVRDSLLSWRGMSLPETTGGDKWGAVRRAALGTTVRWQVAPRWNISAATEAQRLNGMNVKANDGISVDLSASYDLQLRGFDYFSVGPTAHYLSYRRNENFYSWGQGGYYSPQSSVSTGLALQWLSNEGRHWQIQGSVEAGWNNTLQGTEPCFPIALPAPFHNAIRNLPGSSEGIATAASSFTCAGSHDHGPYTHGQFAAVFKLSSCLQAGALVDANVTPGRDRQFAALAFVRYMLAPRPGVFSRDLPRNPRDLYLQLDDGHN
ncbi:MAG TPA: cellulose synthase subunit BcsC-related outer membrane protein [Paraburkholderia sp.]|uniref:cellulose synthase subunit BcsC-related outer membrane protein n=1 Tax=Paraburkholderia sp. TaxID=1926495 RepID=UPI002B48DA8F|nr:cellulose synthase subunit BcsC-related outer membrane protein [Paraburkholderia sp.]HKR43227.1 cellulose synthase subunit BcsC-related outer membrane protein [Paraburkholderia sp.]